MAGKSNVVPLRLQAVGKEEILSLMKNIGGEYSKSARAIEQGSKKASAAIRAVDGAANEAKSALEGMANRGGAVGSVLSGLGPVGLAVGAGFGAAAVGIGAAMKVAREAVSAFDAIGKSADTLMLTTDAFQALKIAASDEGVEWGEVEGAIKSMTKAQSDLLLGSGELFTRLKDTNPELLEMMKHTTDNGERLDIMAKAIRGTENAAERANLAYAAFGESGLGVARMLARQEDGMDGVIDRARDLGLVVREDLIRGAEDMETQFGRASQIIDLQLKESFVSLAPTLMESTRLVANLAIGMGELIGKFQAFGDRSTGQLDDRLDDLRKKLEGAGVAKEELDRTLATGVPLDLSGVSGLEKMLNGEFIRKYNEIALELIVRGEKARQRAAAELRRKAEQEDLEAQKAALEAALAQTEQMIAEAKTSGEFDLLDVAQLRINASAIKAELKGVSAELGRRSDVGLNVPDHAAEAKALAELNKLRAEAIRLQKDLGDYTAYLAQETAQYKKMLDAGLITPAQYEQAVKDLKDELSGVNDAMETWTKLIDSAKSPTDEVRSRMTALNKDFADGKIKLDMYSAAMKALRAEMAEARKSETESLPGFSDAESIRDDLDKAATEAMTPAEKLKQEQGRINALIKEGSLEGDDATAWLELYKKRLDEAAEKGALLTASENLLNTAMSGRIKTMGDLGEVFADMLLNMVQDYLAAQAKMEGGGVLGQFLGLSGAGGGTGSGVMSVIKSIGSFFMGGPKVGMSHSGGAGHSPPSSRVLNGRLSQNESLQVVEDSETILTGAGRMNIASEIANMANERSQMAALVMRAASGEPGSSAVPRVTINNYTSAQVETSTSEGPDGPEVSIDIKGKLKEMVQGGALDKPMKDRYGMLPVGA